MKNNYLLIFIISLLTLSCGNNTGKQLNNEAFEPVFTPEFAKGFELVTDGNAKVLRVKNPWQGASDVIFSYYLKPDADPKNPYEIKVPVERCICLSTTHIAYIDAIGKAQTIHGVSGASYISNPVVREGIAEKRVVDVGYESGLSFETVVSLQPDVVFAYGVSGELTGISTKLNELGIKVVFLGDYLEETPLGKAEWVMAVAAFFNQEDYATNILNPIIESYRDITEKINTENLQKPVVMLNAPWKDSWFVPGGQSYMANLIKDAGGDFIFGENDKRDSYPISIEKAYSEALKAVYWLNPNAAQNLDEVKQMDTRLTDIPAYKNGKVYNNNARMTPGGGSDFWESGVMNPHIILMDIVKILHPQLMTEHELVYFHHLK